LPVTVAPPAAGAPAGAEEVAGAAEVEVVAALLAGASSSSSSLPPHATNDSAKAVNNRAYHARLSIQALLRVMSVAGNFCGASENEPGKPRAPKPVII
jgi:hypothetical protein